jgi:hypothetical protein
MKVSASCQRPTDRRSSDVVRVEQRLEGVEERVDLVYRIALPSQTVEGVPDELEASHLSREAAQRAAEARKAKYLEVATAGRGKSAAQDRRIEAGPHLASTRPQLVD